MAAHRGYEYMVSEVQAGSESTVSQPVTLPHPTLHPRSKRFMEVLNEVEALHLKKSKDYGSATDPFANVIASEDWGLPAWVGVMIRLTDKVKRLQALQRNGELANEAAEDSFRDICAYSVIALILYEESVQSEPTPGS